jgi:alginate O-acetyltransferase complex protein AlgI
VYAAVVIAMLAAGLWHGAAWSYVLFGLYWGVLIALTQLLSVRFPGVAYAEKGTAVHRCKVVFTFYLVAISLVLFRSASLSDAWTVLRELHDFKFPEPFSVSQGAVLLLVATGLLSCHFVNRIDSWREQGVLGNALWPVLAGLFALVFTFGGISNAFIYFQF